MSHSLGSLPRTALSCQTIRAEF